MLFLSQPRRLRRSGEWTTERTVTFIVALAATGSVTLAAQAARISRKSAYALKARDPVFAFAWCAAANAAAGRPAQGDKVEEVHEPPVSSCYGNMSPSRHDRERAFARFMAALRESAPLAPRAPAQ